MFDRRTILQSLAAGVALFHTPLGARPSSMLSFPAPDRELMVPVPGGRVYVRINGRLDGPRLPIIFIHGGPGGNHGSVLNALALSDERAVILYDQLDSGRSDHPNNPTNWKLTRFTDEVEAVRRAVGVERFHLFGHSWGATIALEFAARHPEAVAGLVLASPLISTKAWLADAAARRRQLPKKVQESLLRCDPPAAFTHDCEIAMRPFHAAFIQREPDPAAYKEYYARSGMRVNDTIYERMWGASEFVSTGTLKHYNGERLLHKLNGARTMFIVGQYDEMRPVTAEEFAARVPGSDFAVIPGAGHLWLMDRPSEAIGLLRPWFRAQDY